MTIQVIESEYLEKFEDLKKELEKNNVLLLGAPTVGKTENIIQLLRDDHNVLFICEFGSTIEKVHKPHLGERLLLPGNIKQRLEKEKDLFSKYSFIIIDDFYKVFLECKKENNIEQILKILNRKKGVCIVSTPYRLEWLIEILKEEHLTWLEDFIKKSTCKLLAIEDEAKNILKKFVADEEIVNKILVNCKWIYHFKELLREKLKDYSYGPYKYRPYETYTPYAFIQFRNPDDKYGFIDETILKVFEHSNFTAIHNYLHHIYEGLAEDIKPLLSLGAVMSGVAIPLVIIYAIYQMQKGKSPTYDNYQKSFGNLQYLTYPELEKIEKEAGLPPLTLITNKNISSLNQNEWQKIEDLISHHTEIVELVEKHDKWEGYVERLEQLDKMNGDIKEFIKISDIINKSILNSVEEDLEKEYDPQVELKIQGILPKEVTLQTIGRDELTEDIITQIKNGRRLIILKGAGGSGKTTLAINIAKKLKEEDYFVGVPIPEYSFPISFLEYRLKAASCNSKGIVLFSEYKIAPTRIDEILISTLKLLYSGMYNCLVIVCRDELYRSLENSVQTGAFGGKSTAIELIFEERKPPIQVPPLKIEKIIDQIWKDPKILKQMDKIDEISGGFPLYAILAAHWIVNGNSIVGISKNNFLKKYVNQNVLPFIDEQDAYWYIACVGEIEESHLKSILGLELKPATWENLKNYLLNHLKGNIYKLSPDVFSEVIFTEKCLPNIKNFTNVFIKYPQYLPRVAINISSAYNAAVDVKYEENFSNTIINQARSFTEDIKVINDLEYAACLVALIYGNIPIKPENLIFKKLIEGVKAEWESLSDDDKIEFIPRDIIENLLILLAANLTVIDEKPAILEAISELGSLAVKELERYDENFNPELFIESLYSRIISRISYSKNPIEAEEWINEIEKQFFEITKKFKDFENILNLYSMIVFHISLRMNPIEAEEWVNEIEKRFKGTAEEFEEIQFALPSFYAMIITKISEITTPIKVESWINEIEKRAKDVINKSEYSDNFLTYFYSLIIGGRLTNVEAEVWFVEIEKRFKETAKKFENPNISLWNFYSGALLSIYETNTDLNKMEKLINEIDKKAKDTIKESGDYENTLLDFYSKIFVVIYNKKECNVGGFLNEVENKVKDIIKVSKNPEKSFIHFYTNIFIGFYADKNLEGGKFFLEVEKRAKHTSNEFKFPRSLIVKFYSSNITLLIVSRNFDETKALIFFIEKRAKNTINEFKDRPESIIVHFYSSIITDISAIKNVNEMKKSFNLIEKRAKHTISKFNESSLFFVDFYSEIVFNTANAFKKPPTEIMLLFLEVEKRVMSAVRKNRDSEKLIVYFYSSIFSFINEEKNLELLNEVEKRAKNTIKKFKNSEYFLVSFYCLIAGNVVTMDSGFEKMAASLKNIKKRVQAAAKEFNYPEIFDEFCAKMAYMQLQKVTESISEISEESIDVNGSKK